MFLITINLIFKKGFWDELQYFDFFEAFPCDRRHLWSVEANFTRRATRWRAEQAPSLYSFASNARNEGGGPMSIWKFL